jgi:hypothetical protein
MSGDRGEDERRAWQHRLRVWASRQPSGPADPATVLRMHLRDDPPGRRSYWLGRWSIVTRLVHDAATTADVVEDIGAGSFPMLGALAQRGDFPRGELYLVAVEQDGRWLRWLPPVPVEPVPGSPGDAASRN